MTPPAAYLPVISPAALIAERLGGRAALDQSITTEVELADAVEAGLPTRALVHVVEEVGGSLGTQAVYRVVGNVRTLQRKRATDARLSADESDRLARLARILVRAEAALGARDKAVRWLQRENRALGGRVPLSLLHSDAGAVAVERILGRIEHGVYS